MTGDRANLHPRKPENLCGKKCTTFAKANMARAPRSRRSPSVSPKLVAQACGFVRRRRGRLRRKLAAAPPALIAKGSGISLCPGAVQKRVRKLCGVKDALRRRTARFRGRLVRQPDGEVAPAGAPQDGKPPAPAQGNAGAEKRIVGLGSEPSNVSDLPDLSDSMDGSDSSPRVLKIFSQQRLQLFNGPGRPEFFVGHDRIF